MKIWDEITANTSRKNLINLATLVLLVLGIPLGVFLARQTQQFRPQAANDPISWVVEGCVVERNGVKIARCPDVKFAIDSPFGGPDGGGPSCPSPTPICTPSAGAPKALVELILDDSGSMECTSGQSDAQCKAKQLQVAVRSMKSLIRPDDAIGIQTLSSVKLPINTIAVNDTKYDQVVNAYRTSGSTPLKKALTVAETEVNRASPLFPQNPKKVVILVTDGCPDSGQDPRTQGQKLKAEGWTVAILAIQLGTDQKCDPYGGIAGARQMMTETASDNLFFEVQDPASIPDSLKSIFTQSVCSASLDQQPKVAVLNFSPIKDVYAADPANLGKACNKDSACKDSALVCVNKRCALAAGATPTPAPGADPTDPPNGGVCDKKVFDPNTWTITKTDTCRNGQQKVTYKCSGKSNTITQACGANATPTPTPVPGATNTPRPGQTASPNATATPGGSLDACIGTESYKYAETAAGLDTATETPYTDGIVIEHTFSDPSPGTKTIFVWFKPKVGTPVIKQLSIDLLPTPEITNVDCNSSATGTGVTLTLDGNNFGSQNGTVKGNDTDTNVTNWADSQVIVSNTSLTCNQIIHVILTTHDGDPAEGTYSPGAQIALGAKLFCRAPSRTAQSNVIVSVLGENTPIATQSVSIDEDGLIQGLNIRLKEGEKYQIGIDAPKSVKTLSFPFISKGTAQLVLRSRAQDLADRRYINVLPIGDIITLNKGDGKINAVDKSELNKEWGLPKTNEASQSGDFNQDGKVNSIDWACMRFDFGSQDAIGPNVSTLSSPVNNDDACFPDTFICPDGSVVGKVLPDCDFAACPDVTAAPIPTNTPAPAATATPVAFSWTLNGTFSCDGLNPKSTITWNEVPNAAKYDLYKNNALATANITGLSTALLGDAPGTTTNFVVKAKSASNEILLTSGNVPITAGTCSGATPTPSATATPGPSPTP